MESVISGKVKPFGDKRFTSLFSETAQPQCIVFADRLIDANQEALTLLFNSDINQAINYRIGDISPAVQPDGIESEIKAQIMFKQCRSKGSHSFNWVFRGLDQRMQWLNIKLTTKQYQGYSLIHAELTELDIQNQEPKFDASERSSSRSRDTVLNSTVDHYVLLNEYKKAIDQSSIVSKADSKGIITYVNDKFIQVSGYSPEELIGKPHSIISHPDTPKSVFKELWSTIKSGRVWKGIIKNRKKDGSTYYVDSAISPVVSADGEITEFIAIRNDITEMYQQEKLIVYQNTDEATGLPNRTKLELDLKSSKPSYLAVLQFKELEQFGHVFSAAMNNKILTKVVELITEHFALLTTEVTIYKISNLKFAISCSESLPQDSFLYQLEALLNFIMQLELKIDDFDIPLTVQAGWCDGDDIKLSYALLALKEANKLGLLAAKFDHNNNTFKIDIENAIEWTVKLKNAIAEGKVFLFGQHLFDAEGSRYSTEVLMRYHDDKGRFISPVVFLHHAQKSKIYNQLSKFVITQSCYYFKDKQQRFSVNFTLADLQDREIQELLLYLLNVCELGPYLTMELLETEAFQDNDKDVTEFLYRMKELGVQIAIDDFGSGYSNFNYFTLLPVDIVKIDGSLIADIENNDKHLLLVKSIAEFCHQMNIKVVTEFVENEKIFNKLKALNIDYFQGYHFHKPEQLH